MELYIHIPFCVKKCLYCDFLSAPASQTTISEYMDCLEKQMMRMSSFFREQTIDSVFIGGGTPSILLNSQIVQLMDGIQSNYVLAKDAEVSMEVNPGTLTKEKVRAMVNGGVNRVSIGLQSTEEHELQLLGRIHTYYDFLRSYELLRDAGIRNINVDLMSALPGQTTESYEKSLRQVLTLHPEHISAYSLMIEKGTPFFDYYAEDEALRDAGEQPKILPSEEQEREMYELTGTLLGDYGYERYEISNYAKKGFACRHNIGYWTGESYYGFGLGAASYIEGKRFCNTSDMQAYLMGDFEPQDLQQISKKDSMAEFFFLGLRLTEGVAKAEFVRRFGFSAETIYAEVLSDLREKRLLEDTGTHYRLTPFGRDISNQVLYRFL